MEFKELKRVRTLYKLEQVSLVEENVPVKMSEKMKRKTMCL